MSQPTCHHVLSNGALCKAAPLRNRDYCRFHLQQIGRRMKAARSRARHQAPVLKLPLLEDLYSVQIALMQLADAITYREIDPQNARLLTTVLRLAMQNLKSSQAWERSSRFQLTGGSEGNPTMWDSFEQEHDLPPDLDLSLDPEIAFPPNDEESAGAPYIPGVGMSERASACPPEPALSLSKGSAFGWPNLGEAKVGQILRGPELPVPGATHVTADDVEIVDVYEREGEQAMMQCIAEQQRNRSRRERRVRRLYYEEVARNRNIQFAAQKLVADQKKLDEQTKNQQHQPEADASRKPPQSEAPSPLREAGAGEA